MFTTEVTPPLQIHGAHGYLVNQFLSPHHNRREDEWGGSLENRMRFLREIYRAIRAEVGDDFPVGVKLNSADFQRGGFTEEESMQVIQALDVMAMLDITWYEYQLALIGAGKPSRPKLNAWLSVLKTFKTLGAHAFQRRRA